MKVAVIGTGYVGLVSGTCFAEIGHQVTCIDIPEQKAKIDRLQQGECPIYEPGLKEMIGRNSAAGRLSFALDYEAVKNSDVTFLAVGTPSAASGEANLSYLFAATEKIAPLVKEQSVVVIKSTVPVGTHLEVRKILDQHSSKNFFLVNNPEFLKEGSAVEDFMRPDRVVIGHDNDHAAMLMQELYEPLVRQGNPIFLMSNTSAEMAKYASNCFLATKISFINEMAKLCELTGADIDEVKKGMTSDKRIGHHFFYPGVGYGGSCFPKDVKALMYTAKNLGMDLKIVRATEEINQTQKTILFEKCLKHFSGDLVGKTFAFWGVSFKPNTDDIREAPSIDMAKALISKGAKIHFCDPEGVENFQQIFADSSQCVPFKDKYECLENCDGMFLLTEWGEYRSPDLNYMKEKLKDPIVFDGRNIFSNRKMKEHNFTYYSIGRKNR